LIKKFNWVCIYLYVRWMYLQEELDAELKRLIAQLRG
jgi:hypothetical protein